MDLKTASVGCCVLAGVSIPSHSCAQYYTNLSYMRADRIRAYDVTSFDIDESASGGCLAAVLCTVSLLSAIYEEL